MRILSRWKTHLVSLSLVSGSVFVSLVIGEIALRLFFPSQFMVKDFDTGLRLSPGYRNTIVEPEFTYQVQINGAGFRSPSLKKVAEERIVVLGDSHTFGVGVPQEATFSSILAKKLNREVVNTASPGWDLIQFSRFAQSRLVSLAPSLVVYVLYAGNDLTNNGSWRATPEGLLPVASAPAPASFWREWELPKLLARALKRREESKKKLEAWRPYEPYLRLCERTPGPLATRYYEESKKLFTEFVEAIRVKQIPLVVAVLPFKTAVEGSPEKDSELYDFSKPTRTVIGWAEELQVSRVNLLTELKRDFDKFHAPLYYFADGHLTPRGHRIVAENLIPAIEAMPSAKRVGYFSGSGAAGASPF